jgi:catechol 2,3-dioxygenase-like lactoylglutathione lyase family enzyme
MYIQHVSIPRPPGDENREKARQFYSDLLGLAEKPVPQSLRNLDLIWFQMGDQELHCLTEEPHDDPSGRHFCLVVDDVEQTRTKLIAAGFKPWDATPIPGRSRFFCRDPFHNTIEFTTISGDYLELEREPD